MIARWSAIASDKLAGSAGIVTIRGPVGSSVGRCLASNPSAGHMTKTPELIVFPRLSDSWRQMLIISPCTKKKNYQKSKNALRVATKFCETKHPVFPLIFGHLLLSAHRRMSGCPPWSRHHRESGHPAEG